MEHGDPFFHCGQHSKSSSVSSVLQAGNSSANNGAQTPSNLNNDNAAPHVVVHEKYQYMPITNVTRIMQRVLPHETNISDDVKEIIQKCVSRYINFITVEANEQCQCEYRKTVTAEDLLSAMGKLGFDNYVEPLTLFLHRYRHIEGDRSAHRGVPIPVTMRPSVDSYRSEPAIGMPPATLSPPLTSYGSDFPMDPTTNVEMFYAMGMDGFFGDWSGAGSSGGSMANFDNFPHLKLDHM